MIKIEETNDSFKITILNHDAKIEEIKKEYNKALKSIKCKASVYIYKHLNGDKTLMVERPDDNGNGIILAHKTHNFIKTSYNF